MRPNNIGQNTRQNTIVWAVIEDSRAWCRMRLSVRSSAQNVLFREAVSIECAFP